MAVQALALIGDSRALEAVRAARRDPSPVVREQAERVLPAFEASLRKARPMLAAPSAAGLRGARYLTASRLRVRGASGEAAGDLDAVVTAALGKLPHMVTALPADKP